MPDATTVVIVNGDANAQKDANAKDTGGGSTASVGAVTAKADLQSTEAGKVLRLADSNGAAAPRSGRRPAKGPSGAAL